MSPRHDTLDTATADVSRAVPRPIAMTAQVPKTTVC
jgi:hypothetical protein